MTQVVTVTTADVLREAARFVLERKAQSIRSATLRAAELLMAGESYVNQFVSAFHVVYVPYGSWRDKFTYLQGRGGGQYLITADVELMAMMLLFTAEIYESPPVPPKRDIPGL